MKSNEAFVKMLRLNCHKMDFEQFCLISYEKYSITGKYGNINYLKNAQANSKEVLNLGRFVHEPNRKAISQSLENTDVY